MMTHIPRLSIGPNAGSWRPPSVGRLVLSKRIGLVMALTEMARISSLLRKENEADAILDVIGTVGSILNRCYTLLRAWQC